MSNYFLIQDAKKCIGCHSCEIQCKTNKSLPVGPKPCQVMQVGPKAVDNMPRISFVFIPCFHCEKAWCIEACPTGAMQKRKKDGIVFVNQELCVGCKACINACPWGAPQWDPEKKKAVKCDYCMERIDRGLKPACVTVCVTQCLEFGSVDHIAKSRRERYAKNIASADFQDKV